MIRLSSVQARFLVPGGSHGQAAWGLRLLAFLGASLLIVLGLGGVAVRAGHTTDAAERPSTSSVHIYDSLVHPYDQQPAWSVSLRERRGGTTGPWTGLDGQREVVTRALDGSGVAAETGGPGAWGTASESMSARAAAYQARITGAAEGSVYRVNGVKFDGFANGALQEAKGPGYANFVKNGRFQPWYNGADGLASQAQRQARGCQRDSDHLVGSRAGSGHRHNQSPC